MRDSLLIVLCLLGVFARLAYAHWLEHKYLPEWARPGRVRWCLHYGPLNQAMLDLVAETKQNLLHGPYLEGSSYAARAQALGIRGMTYIPLTWDYENGKIFDRYPALREAEAKKADGSRLFAYHAGRYTGCYNQPGYRQRRMEELDTIDKSAAIFFDTTTLVPCHCYVCCRKFKEFSLQNYGREITLPKYDGVSRKTQEDRAFYRFRIESVIDYFRTIREHLNRNKPPNLICPNLHWGNAWHIELIERGVPDLICFEETGHPPFRKKFMGYKIAQAASHGKSVGQLIYLPPEISSERGYQVTDYSYAGLPQLNFQAPLLPQEIMLAIAEAQSCNGVYIPGYCIAPAAPMTDHADPITAANLAALKKYYEFVVEHEPLYVGARPGADVALLYPIRSQLWHPPPISEDMPTIGNMLAEAGIPFEVITDSDLVPMLLKDVKILIVPGATCLARAHGETIRTYVEEGGRAIISQTPGTYDENGDPMQSPPIPSLQNLNTVTELSLGKGRILFSPEPLSEMSKVKASALLRGFCRDVSWRVENPSAKIFVNILVNKSLNLSEVHIVNYDLRYVPLRPTAGDDDGTQEFRTPFVTTACRAKKYLDISDPSRFSRPIICFSGASASDRGYELVVTLNGKDVAVFPAFQLKRPGWHTAPVERTLLRKGRNEVIIRVEGKPNTHPDYFNLAIDGNTSAGRSFWSVDAGLTYSGEDLSSFDPGLQRGEYMIRISEWRDITKPWPADKVLDSVKLFPAKDVTVSLKTTPGSTLYCALICPEHAPLRLEPEPMGDRIKITVPRVDIYAILLISSDRRTIESIAGPLRLKDK